MLNPLAHLKAHLLKGELLIIRLDAAHVVRGGGVQSLHEQMQRVAELKDKTIHFEEGWRCCRVQPKLAGTASHLRCQPPDVTQREPPHQPSTCRSNSERTLVGWGLPVQWCTTATSVCSGLYPVESWKCPRVETAQTLWAPVALLDCPHRGKKMLFFSSCVDFWAP